MSRYSVRYRCASSSVRSGHARRKMSSSGRPVIAPTLSNASAVPPCAAMTRFAVSTTKRTLSVSVPSRSQRTARRVTSSRPSAFAAPPGRDDRGLDGQRGLLGKPAIAKLLAMPHEILELVVKRIGVLQTRVDDLEAQVAHRIGLGEAFEDHLADALRPDLGRSALADRRFDVVDEPVDRVWRELLRGSLADRARELAAVEFLARPVALHDLDAGRFRALARREALAARVARAASADRV